ncbi:MAG: hypothetical protein L0Z53_20580, partial [Acidobacteriales bacterium]|nr:hypothetical protein [Terriglobales bacterium]
AERILGRAPDMLLWPNEGDVILGSQGVWFREVCFKEPPKSVEILARGRFDDEGYDLMVDSHCFRFDHKPVVDAEELKRWVSFYFEDFTPHLASWHKKNSGDAGMRVRRKNALVCPECRRELLSRLGEVGVRCELPNE